MNFILRMAWRDSRASRRKLALYSISIVLGIAAIVASGSFGAALREAVDVQARSLLGADLVLTTRTPLTPASEAVVASAGGRVSRETNFSSMLVVPKANDATRLVQVRGLEGAFPFYGEMKTEPAAAVEAFRRGEGAIVEDSIVAQYDLRPGDRIKLGEATLPVLGALKKIAGESPAFAMLAPRVFVPPSFVGKSNLIQPGALVRYKVALAFAPGADVAAIERDLRQRLSEQRPGFDTVDERKRDVGQLLENIDSFLRLVGFVALILGGVGIASAISVHVRSKLATVAVLRCLGASARTAFGIYLLQGLALGVLGGIGGGALGLVAQYFLPAVFAQFVPFELELGIVWKPVFIGVGAGVLICVLFALIPLLAVRRVSPLQAIRSDFEAATRGWRDPATILVAVLIGGAVVGMAILQSTRPGIGIGFAVALGLVFALLALVAKLLAWTVRRLPLRGLPYVMRQGLANLHRPNNRTVLVLLSLGLGTFLVSTLYLARGTLLSRFERMGGEGRPNLAFFDIQDDQRDGIVKIMAETGMPMMQEAAIVTMRLAELKGRRVEDILRERNAPRDPAGAAAAPAPNEEEQATRRDSRGQRREATDPGARGDPAGRGPRNVPGWTLRREYRSTFREELTSTEKLASGTWIGRVEPGVEPVPVSMERNLARDLQLALGDELVFDVQGLRIRCVLKSTREVEWQRVQPNFFVVFPAGVLEPAPKFRLMVTRAPDAAKSAELQRRIVAFAPNVSAIDLGMIIESFDSIVDKVSWAVKFMALFTVATGVVVLVGAVLTGRFQRIRETVLLRTLGASRRQVQRILLIEYAVLGLLAASTGLVLSVGADFLLAHFVFKVPWSPPGAEIAGAVGAVVALTLTTGLLSNRGVCDHPPLQVLRQET